MSPLMKFSLVLFNLSVLSKLGYYYVNKTLTNIILLSIPTTFILILFTLIYR